MYDKEAEPQWVFQKEKKEKEEEEVSKSSSKEVAKITNPDDDNVGSPCASVTSHRSETSKESYGPERVFDTTKNSSYTPYAAPKGSSKRQ